MNELNEKLAEFAGFQRGKGRKTFKKEGGTLYIDTSVWWLTPIVSGYRGEYEHLPNFTRSLDACFKWLVPKLTDYGVLIYSHVQHKKWEVSLLHEQTGQAHTAVAGTPALAFCLAIEKLVDGEK